MKISFAKILSLFFLVSFSKLHANVYDLDVFNSRIINNPHKIKIINSGIASLEQKLDLIENAKKTIDLEYYIYNADLSGRMITQALTKKAKEGVKIRVLFDVYMVKSSITNYYVNELQNVGIEVKFFNNFALKRFKRILYRNHRKNLIVDNKILVTGGRNVADSYYDLSNEFNFLDREVFVEGDIVSKVSESFNIIWKNEFSIDIPKEKMPNADDLEYNRSNANISSKYYQDLEKYTKGVENAKKFLKPIDSNLVESIRLKGKEKLSEAYNGHCNDISYVSELPIIGYRNRDFRQIKNDIFTRINNAKESLTIETPYFIVDDESAIPLNNALERGVKVDVLTNGLNSTDAVFVYDVFKATIKQWIDKGLIAYTYTGDSPTNYQKDLIESRYGIHAKTYVIDNLDTIIGTYNFDPRSANYNIESIIACENNPEIAAYVKNDIQKRMDLSFKLDEFQKVDETSFYKVGFLKKILFSVIYIPSQWFDFLM